MCRARISAFADRPTVIGLVVAFATAMALRATLGYRPFPSIDDFIYVPLAWAHLDPALYPSDAFIQGFVVHVPLLPWLIAALEKLGDLALGLWLIVLVLSALTTVAAFRLMQALGAVGLLLPVVAAVALGGALQGLGRGQFDGAFGSGFHMQWVALCAALWCYDAFVRGKGWSAGALLGLSTIAHPVVGAHVAFVLGAGLVFAGPGRFALATRIATAAAVVGAPLIGPLVLEVLGGSGGALAARPDAIELGYVFRTPHEFTLGATSPHMRDMFTLIAAAGVLGCALLAQDDRDAPTSCLIGLLVGQAVLAGAFLLLHGSGLDLAHLPGAVLVHQLHLSRTTPLLMVLAMVAFGAALERRLLAEDRHRSTVATLTAVAVTALAVTLMLLTQLGWQPVMFAASTLAFFSVAARRARRWPVATLAAWLLVGVVGLALTATQDRLRAEPTSDEAELYAWVRETTPRDALFIIPPDAQAFRFYARRSAYVDFKTFPSSAPELIPAWRERLEQVAAPDAVARNARGWPGVHDWARTYANRNTPARIADLLAETGAGYFVWDARGLAVPPFLPVRRPADPRLERVFANERFEVYRPRAEEVRADAG